jgi:hypothetical protein
VNGETFSQAVRILSPPAAVITLNNWRRKEKAAHLKCRGGALNVQDISRQPGKSCRSAPAKTNGRKFHLALLPELEIFESHALLNFGDGGILADAQPPYVRLAGRTKRRSDLRWHLKFFCNGH